MEYNTTKYVVWKSISDLIHLRGNIIGKSKVMPKNKNEGKRIIENSSPLYQIYTPTAI